jgi:hypothetical protein
MKPSEALRLARDMMAQIKLVFICYHLDVIGNPGAQKALEHIYALLSPHKNYGMWLKNHDADWHERYKNTPGAHLEARLLWIDDMIEYWESKGE